VTQVLARLEGLGPSVAGPAAGEPVQTSVDGWSCCGKSSRQMPPVEWWDRHIVPVIVADGRRLDDQDVLERVNRAADPWRERSGDSSSCIHQHFSRP